MHQSESEVAQSCPTLSDPMDCSLPASSVHGIFQARVLEWGAIAFSKTFREEWNPEAWGGKANKSAGIMGAVCKWEGMWEENVFRCGESGSWWPWMPSCLRGWTVSYGHRVPLWVFQQETKIMKVVMKVSQRRMCTVEKREKTEMEIRRDRAFLTENTGL